MVITSKENDLIKEIAKLKDKKYRTDKYFVEGIKIVKEAISENQKIERIIASESFDITTIESIYNYEITLVSENVFHYLSDVENPQGIMAVILKNHSLQIDENADIIFALDNCQDPGNLGTIIRTLDSAGISQLLVSKGTVDCYSPKVTRSTMGSIFRVNVIECENLRETLLDLKNRVFKVVTTELEGSSNLYETDLNKAIVVMGNEANGVSTEIREISDIKTKIPMLGKTESLNLATATTKKI